MLTSILGIASDATESWQSVQSFSVSLNATGNLFAVHATNYPGAGANNGSSAGVIAAVQVTYTDASTTIFSTDATWKATTGTPSGFEQPAFSDTSFAAATVVGAYGDNPWGSIAVPSALTTSTLELAGSNWLWSNSAGSTSAPSTIAAFRKTFNTPAGKSASNATVIITGDDGFAFYLNGVYIGSSLHSTDVWKYAQRYTISLQATTNLFAAKVVNGEQTAGNAAGLLAAIQIFYTDGTSDVVRSDTTWRVNAAAPAGFEVPSTDDTSWANAVSLGLYGIAPWGTNVGISDALPAALAGSILKTPSLTTSSTTTSSSPAAQRTVNPVTSVEPPMTTITTDAPAAATDSAPANNACRKKISMDAGAGILISMIAIPWALGGVM